jgi:hypothetical protein
MLAFPALRNPLRRVRGPTNKPAPWRGLSLRHTPTGTETLQTNTSMTTTQWTPGESDYVRFDASPPNRQMEKRGRSFFTLGGFYMEWVRDKSPFLAGYFWLGEFGVLVLCEPLSNLASLQFGSFFCCSWRVSIKARGVTNLSICSGGFGQQVYIVSHLSRALV